jgi:superfamily II DNA or RNA helicase
MQSTSTVSGVSFKKKLREGQRRSLERPEVLNGPKLNIKLPTGYGKTLTACGVFAIRQKHLLSTRLLYVVPSTAQLNQFRLNAVSDFVICGVDLPGEHKITDIGFTSEHDVLNRHRQNKCHVFVTSIQYLSQGGYQTVKDLLEQGQWMACIDEYHHYGIDKKWGIKTLQLPFSFLLAMSATPYRPKEDSAFGAPHVSVTYREGVTEKQLKPLYGHAYDYRIDAVDGDGNIKTYTTAELVAEVGDDNPDSIEKFRIKKKMRWSPKYVSPLVRTPISRMRAQRIITGQHNLQFLISAMCVSHAELVCEQVRSQFPDLRIDWVGTGEFGKDKAKNEEILNDFCPPKSINPREPRPEPKLDGLVHVGMAGEGLDPINISEIIFLRTASFNNQTHQIIGRGGRLLLDKDGEAIECNVSFDGSTELSRGLKVDDELIRAVGSSMINAMDLNSTTTDDDDDDDKKDDDLPPELPEEPTIYVQNMELIGIDSGDLGVQQMAALMRQYHDPIKRKINFDIMDKDPNHPDWKFVIDQFIAMQSIMAREHDEKAIVAQWKESVETALSNVTHVCIGLMARQGTRVERSLAGDIKKRINGRKKGVLGQIRNEVEVYKQHYAWLQVLGQKMRDNKKIPSWLT